jgi:hypothetical protein
MPTNVFRGDSMPIAQVDTLPVGGTPTVGQTFGVTINRKTVTYTTISTDTTLTIIAASIAAALTTVGAAIKEFAEIIWTSSVANVIATGPANGGTFTIASTSATGSGTPTFTHSTTTAPLGLNHWDDPANWSLNRVPLAGDDVYLTGTSTPILYGLSQGYLVYNSLHVDASYTGQLGLPTYNTSGYLEYRPLYLQCSPLAIYYGENIGSGSSLVKIDTGTNAVAWNIYQTGSPAVQGQPSLYIAGSNAANTLVVTSGNVGIALETGTTCQIPVIETGYLTSQNTDVTLHCGLGATLGAITQFGGTIYAQTNLTTVNINAGVFYLAESATLTTLTGNGGTFFDLSNGLLGTITSNSGFTYDKNQDIRSKTITNATLRNGSTFRNKPGLIAFSNPILIDGTLDQSQPSYVTLDVGNGKHLQTS